MHAAKPITSFIIITIIIIIAYSIIIIIIGIGEQAKSQQEKSNNVRIIQNDQRQDTTEFTQDQSKRMVTIRRINVPHAEPQVTVTAKGISPDKDKLLYTFINGQLIANVATTPPLMTSTNDINSKSKLNAKSSESVLTNAKTAKKQSEPVLVEKPTKKNAKEKPMEKSSKLNDKNNLRKASPDIFKSLTGKTTKTALNVNPSTSNAKEKDKDKQKQKKGGKRDVDQEVETITNATKELAIADEKPRKEKKKEKKAIKFEYADPNYKVNQFDLLDMDEDDGYYIESSEDDSSDDEPPMTRPTIVIPTPAPATVTSKPNPPLSNQSSIESQSAHANVKVASKCPATATLAPLAKSVKSAETTKKGKNEANAKTQLQKSDRKSSADSTAANTTTKSLKSQPQNQTHQSSVSMAVGKQTIANVDDSNLSKKQKKKLEKKQSTPQPQQFPNPTRVASRTVCDKLPNNRNTNVHFQFKIQFHFIAFLPSRILILMQ